MSFHFGGYQWHHQSPRRHLLVSRYLCGGPGSIGGFYVKDGLDNGGRMLAGWWGNKPETRFQMDPKFDAQPGANGYKHSNPPIFSSLPLIATLELVEKAGGIQALRAKSVKLTSYFYDLLAQSKWYRKTATEDPNSKCFTIITPEDPEQRGTQLSLLFLPLGSRSMDKVFDAMTKRGVIGDERKPDVMRLAPCPLYCGYQDVKYVVDALEASMAEL